MKPIAVGDLVVVARACCSRTFNSGCAGVPRTVVDIYRKPTYCPFCKWTSDDCLKADLGGSYCAPVAWLKRIPPIEELEGVKTEETLKEPA